MEFYRVLRPETKFEDMERLGEQIRRDAEEARVYFANEEKE